METSPDSQFYFERLATPRLVFLQYFASKISTSTEESVWLEALQDPSCISSLAGHTLIHSTERGSGKFTASGVTVK